MKKETRINKADFQKLLGDGWTDYSKILNNCYCSKCKTPYESTIVNYDVFINERYDAILKGDCKDCGGKINRYTETGEDPMYRERLIEYFNTKNSD